MGEWTGAWSDDSKEWYPELKEKLQCVSRDDGIFFIKFEDYLAAFNNTQICHDRGQQNLHENVITHDFVAAGEEVKPGTW